LIVSFVVNSFPCKKKLQSHIYIHHKKPENVCHICAKKIRDKGAFLKHIRLHTEDSGPRIKCPRADCESWLKDADNLKQHMKLHNDEGKQFICEECGKSCKNRRALSTHFRYSHMNANFICGECQKSFKKAISLKVSSI